MARVSVIVALGICTVAWVATAQSDHDRVAVQQQPDRSLLSSVEVSFQRSDDPATSGGLGLGVVLAEELVLGRLIEIGIRYPMHVALSFRDNGLYQWSLDGKSLSSHLAARLGTGAYRTKVGGIAGVDLSSDGSCCFRSVSLRRVGLLAQVSHISDPTVVAHNVSISASFQSRKISALTISPTTTLVEVLSGSMSLLCAVGLTVEVYPQYRLSAPTIRIAFRRKRGSISTGYGMDALMQGEPVIRWEAHHEWNI